MGFLIAAILFIGGGLLIVDGFLLAGSVANIMQQDFAQSRLVGGATVVALASILWVLCGISESITKMVKERASVAAPAQPQQPPASASSGVPTDRHATSVSGWTCAECGKVNPPMSPVCACGNLRS